MSILTLSPARGQGPRQGAEPGLRWSQAVGSAGTGASRPPARAASASRTVLHRDRDEVWCPRKDLSLPPASPGASAHCGWLRLGCLRGLLGSSFSMPSCAKAPCLEPHYPQSHVVRWLPPTQRVPQPWGGCSRPYAGCIIPSSSSSCPGVYPSCVPRMLELGSPHDGEKAPVGRRWEAELLSVGGSPCSCQPRRAPAPAAGCKPLALLLGSGAGPRAVVKGHGMLLGEQGRVGSTGTLCRRGCPGLMGVGRCCGAHGG